MGLFVFLSTSQIGAAESLRQMQEMERKKQFGWQESLPDYSWDQRGPRLELTRDKIRTGFFETKVTGNNQETNRSVLHYIVSDPSVFDSKLVFGFKCKSPASVFPFSRRNIPVKWEMAVSDQTRSGEVNTDASGLIQIQVGSKGSLNGRVVKIQVGKFKAEAILGRGPYQFVLDEKNCRTKSP